jgi:two-component system cell cycle sensor histidine kinase/response regulator CckA
MQPSDAAPEHWDRVRALLDGPVSPSLARPIESPSGSIRDFEFLILSATAVRLLDCKAPEGAYSRLSDSLRQQELFPLLTRVAETRQAETSEQTWAVAGSMRWVEVTAFPARDDTVGLWLRDITDRKETEERVRVSEERLRLALLATGDALWDWNTLTGYVWRNQALAEMAGETGPPAEDFAWWAERLHPEDRPRVMAALEAALNEGTSFSYEYRFRHAQGHYRHILDRGYPTRDAAGRVIRVVGVMTDITARKQMEAELRKLALIAQRASNSVVLTDAQRRIEWVNDSFRQATGYTLEEVRGRTPGSFLQGPGTDPAVVRDMRERLNRGEGFSVEILNYRKNGEPFWQRVDVQPMYTDGALSGFLGLQLDITPHKQTELKLVESETLLRQAGRVARLGAWSLDPATNRPVWSEEVYRLYGAPVGAQFTVEEALAFYPPEARVLLMEALERAVREGTPWEIETPFINAQGKRLWVRVSGEPVMENGRCVRLVGTIQDISPQKEMESRLLQAQKMDAIGRLAGGVAHDFNNLLTVIRGYGEMLLAMCGGDNPATPLLHEILTAASRAGALTQQLLAFSRRQPQHLVPVDLNAQVREMVSMLRRVIGEHIRLDTRLEADLGMVRADPAQLEQVILNLVLNARDAVGPQGGQVEITTANVERARTPGGSAEWVMLSVADTGCGMTEEVKAHLFEPFFTTKAAGKGTGLGLATVYGIVDGSQGWMEVESSPGAGSVFRVFLPRLPRRTESELEQRQTAAVSGGQETILVVEDEPAVREFVTHVLAAQGYRVLSAGTPEKALAVASRERPIDLMLSDVVMPGMTGFELAARLAQQHPGLRVLFMSGYYEAQAEQGASRPVLLKPFSPDVLAQTVRRCLDGEAE